MRQKDQADHDAYMDYFRCPACGRLYGDKQWVCENCQEHKKCCTCGDQKLIRGGLMRVIIGKEQM